MNENNTPVLKKHRRFFLIPFILVLALLPLIVRYCEYDSKLGGTLWFGGNSANDFFLYWKSFFFIILSSIMACMLLILFYRKRKTFVYERAFLPLLAYILLAFLSSVFSQYSYFCFLGIYEDFESIWVLTGYCITAAFGCYFLTKERDIKIVLYFLLAGAGILSLIGVFQAFSLDFYKSTIGKMTYLPARFWNLAGSLSFRSEGGQVYASLLNPNYVGVYVSLLLPLPFTMLIFSKSFKSFTGPFCLVVTLIICLFGCRSKSGILAVLASFLLLALLLRCQLRKHKRSFLAGLLFIGASFFIVNLAAKNALLSGILNVFHQEAPVQPSLTEIGTNSDNVSVTYNENTMYIYFTIIKNGTDFEAVIKDDAGQPVPYHFTDKDSSLFTSDDSRFPFSIQAAAFEDDRLGFTLMIDGKAWDFTNQTEDGTFYCYAPSRVLTKISHPETALFDGKERFASGRGFIWSRTIPLLKKTIFLGTGPDTFYLVYPNDDFIGMSNFGYENTFITKPHNMYLQIGVQTGLLSLLAFLAFYFIYFAGSIRLYWRHALDTWLSRTGVSILTGTFAYMVAGLANDSTVAVAPVFWGLIGIGFAVNRLIKNSMAKED